MEIAIFVIMLAVTLGVLAYPLLQSAAGPVATPAAAPGAPAAFCPGCGRRAGEDELFCPGCGRKREAN